MRKILLATVAVLAICGSALTPAASAQRDVLIAAMDNGRGEKPVHKQMAEHESCMSLIANLTKLQKRGQKMQLTFTDPPFSGYVIHIYCVRLDGKIIGRNGIVEFKLGAV